MSEPRRGIAGGILITLAVIVVVLATVHTYYIRSDFGGYLLWNANEAYVFVSVGQRGYRLSYLGFLAEAVKESFPFGASPPDDKHASVEALRITPNTIQHYVTDNMNAGGTFDPFGQSIYSRDLDTGVLMKWSDTRFEPASTEDQQRFWVAFSSGKVPPGTSYDNVDGWSRRATAGTVTSDTPTAGYTERDAKVVIELDGRPLTFVMNSGYISHEAYIDLARPGQSPERIWYLDERARKVSKAEYERTFWKPVTRPHE